jgi:hypothetical protein
VLATDAYGCILGIRPSGTLWLQLVSGRMKGSAGLLGLLLLAHPSSSQDTCTTSAAAPLIWRDEALQADNSSKIVRWLSYKGSPQKNRLLRRLSLNSSAQFTSPTYGGEGARRVFRFFGWRETRDDEWAVLWTGVGQ